MGQPTSKLNGLESYAWLKDPLENLPAWPYSRIDELLLLWGSPPCNSLGRTGS